jgi:hypothetical protein
MMLVIVSEFFNGNNYTALLWQCQRDTAQRPRHPNTTSATPGSSRSSHTSSR